MVWTNTAMLIFLTATLRTMLSRAREKLPLTSVPFDFERGSIEISTDEQAANGIEYKVRFAELVDGVLPFYHAAA